jgi:VWFA-related protein
MRSLLVVVALCAPVGAQTFRSTVDHVAVPVTIHREPNESATDLRPEDFREFDNGRPAPIVAFGKVRQSVHVLLLLDTSRSMSESLSDIRSAAGAVIAQLAPDDSIRVGTFSSFLRLSPPLSADDSQLATRLALAPGANMTSLYDALVEGCSVFTNEMDRRAIIVVSDGTDTASSASARTVMQHAAEANVAIYAVGLSSRSMERGKSLVRPPDPVLREIAADTGGGYVHAGTNRDVSGVFKAMVEELHQQYMLGFIPAHADGRVHSLMVTTRRSNATIRARKHYLAPAP